MDALYIEGGSKRNRGVFYKNNFHFCFQKSLANGIDRWVCAGKKRFGCKASLKAVGKNVVEAEECHSHEANQQDKEMCIIKVGVKRNAAEDMTSSPSQIVRSVVSENCEAGVDEERLKSLRQMAYRAKQRRLQPTLPKSRCEAPLTKARERTMMATGVSHTSVRRVAQESKRIQNKLQDNFRPTAITRSRIAPSTSPELYDTGACRSIIFKSIVESDRPLDTKQLYAKLIEAKLYKAGPSSLRRFLKNLGFQVKRTRSMTGKGGVGVRAMIVEQHDRQYQKFVYLRDLRKYRAEGRQIIFTALTKLARAHCKGSKKPVKGEVLKVTNDMFADVTEEQSHEQWRAVLLDAGNEQGFVTSGFLIWRCIKKLGSNLYDEGANYRKYVKWVNDNLLPNIPEGAAVVLDHDAIYDKHADPIPSHSADKEEMKVWLTSKGIDFSLDAAKVELYELIRQNKRHHCKLEIDSILEKAGHPVLRIPQHYTELNPMMIMLKEVKTWMKGQAPTVNPRFVDIAKLTVSKMLTTPTEVWTSKVEKCQTVADEYFSYQAPMEEQMEKAVSANNGCFDSESEEEKEGGDSDKEIEISSSEGSEEDDKDHEFSPTDTDPDTWVTPPPSIFMAGDDIASSSAPQPKRQKDKSCGPSSGTPAPKRQKTPESGASQESDEWELDGLVTIKEEPL